MRPSRDNILAYLKSPGYHPSRIRELARHMKVPQAAYRAFRRLIHDMVGSGDLVELRRKRIALPGGDGFVIGQIQGHQGGFGFVNVSPDAPDVFIGEANIGRALHGDTVMVRMFGRRRGLNPEGKVIRVVERGNGPVVGTYHQDGGMGLVIPDDPRVNRHISIGPDDARKAKPGQKVVVNVTAWKSGQYRPEGRVVEVIGFPDDRNLAIVSLIRSYDLALDFPDSVLTETSNIPDGIPGECVEDRLDLRDTRCFTIDPPEARDFDDAVSIEHLGTGSYRLGVHIADVSAYVPEGGLIDREALYRGTSVYLVDRVIPMLPHRLTNELCSLKPNEDRLTMSVIMDIDEAGIIGGYVIRESMIRSARRMTYQEAQAWIESGDPSDMETGNIVSDLRHLKALSRNLLKERLSRGGLDFDLPEPYVLLNEDGAPTEVGKEDRLDSNRLIEECMLAANRTVARYMIAKDLPAVYRIHERPKNEKLQELLVILTGFGYQLSQADVSNPLRLQKFMTSIQDHPEHIVINSLIIRSMQKAKYSVGNMGHYGLAFEEYLHFTSPIRRYPDLAVHRLLKENSRGSLSMDRIDELDKILRKTSEIASQREKRAEEVERESVKIKQTEYMEKKIGEEFDGVVSGAVPSGVFVELKDSLIDGLIHVSNLTDDYYQFDRDHMRLVGTRTHKVFRLGVKVRVRVIEANRNLRRINFALVHVQDMPNADIPSNKGSKPKNGPTGPRQSHDVTVRKTTGGTRRNKNRKSRRRR